LRHAATHPDEDSVVDLAQAQQLHDLLGLRGSKGKEGGSDDTLLDRSESPHRPAQHHGAYLGVDLVQTADADGEQQLGLRLDVEATLGLGLALQADSLLLLCS
jgi:hypothetical protein